MHLSIFPLIPLLLTILTLAHAHSLSLSLNPHRRRLANSTIFHNDDALISNEQP
jgi:hypothetical protein